ncbi:hypothetical protein [Brevibacillus sp. MER 51]|nr:hypothetical protein [Brevibacillus sp. MER 51]
MTKSFNWGNILLWGVGFGSHVVMVCLGPLTLFIDKPMKIIKRR